MQNFFDLPVENGAVQAAGFEQPVAQQRSAFPAGAFADIPPQLLYSFHRFKPNSMLPSLLDA
jgi:hypothetical protein